jgi:hypothetical protein
MDGAKCMDCADWFGRCHRLQNGRRQLNQIASSDACSSFTPKAQKTSSGGSALSLEISKIDAVDWLTDERWIVFSFYGGFAQHLEHYYFTPGTPKNEEFEVMIAPVKINGLNGIAPFYRIRDSPENGESLNAALAEYNGTQLLTLAKLDEDLEGLRQKIKEVVLPALR